MSYISQPRRRSRSRSRSSSRGRYIPTHHPPTPTIVQTVPPMPIIISRQSSRSSSRSRCAGPSSTIEPPLDPGTIQLDSTKDSKITSVSVYSARAEVTRVFTVNVKAGLNQLLVRGLPRVLYQDSFRVEGRGSATIHDVTLGQLQPPSVHCASSETVAELQVSKQRVDMALERTRRTARAHEAYLMTVNSEHLDTDKLFHVTQTYGAAAAELDNTIIELEAQKKNIEKQIQVEKAKLRAMETGNYDQRLSMKAAISVFADVEGEITIALIYAVANASWTAGYDIRVDMQNKGKPIQLAYKGTITQSTGEDWNDVRLILETANPTFGISVPTLDPWSLSVKRPVPRPGYVPQQPTVIMQQPMSMPMMPMGMVGMPMTGPIVQHRSTDVSSKGTVNATFSVPGLISIPSDGQSHNVTITALFLENTMSWVCVPKKDSKIHLKAKIKNASEYTLLAGSANVYLDGSFISKTNVPLVSPDETFDCPLGLDPSIRVTYHPRSKKISKSGFYTKSTNYVYQQRITIFNTKTHALDGLKVLDQFPISEDSTIVVKHVNPPLVVPSPESANAGSTSSSSNNPPNVKGIAPVKVSEGVVAQWDGADEVESGNVSIDSVGKDGKLAWICSIPAGTKLGLVLHWEVTTPVRTEVNGL